MSNTRPKITTTTATGHGYPLGGASALCLSPKQASSLSKKLTGGQQHKSLSSAKKNLTSSLIQEQNTNNNPMQLFKRSMEMGGNTRQNNSSQKHQSQQHYQNTKIGTTKQPHPQERHSVQPIQTNQNLALSLGPLVNQQQQYQQQNQQHFAFDIRQFYPMSPQIVSYSNNHLKDKAAAKPAGEKIIAFDNTDSRKISAQNRHRRNQSKSQNDVTEGLFGQRFFQSKDDLAKISDQREGGGGQSIDERLTQNLVKEDNYTQLKPKTQVESRNARLKFNSLADTNDKKNSFKKTYDYTTTTDNISSSKGGADNIMGGTGGRGASIHTDQQTSLGGWATSLSPLPVSKMEKFAGGYMENQQHLIMSSNEKMSPLKNLAQGDQVQPGQLEHKKVQFLDNKGLSDSSDNDANSNNEASDDDCNYNEEVEPDDENENSDDEEDYDEQELREEVGDLPPKIENTSHYEDSENEEDDEDDNDLDEAPTVVIDTSMDEKDVIQYRGSINGTEGNFEGSGIENYNSVATQNIQAAMRSIQVQEEEENRQDKRPVAILSAEEEQLLEFKINEIRDRIRRGEPVGNQKMRLEQQNKIERDRESIDIQMKGHFKSQDEGLSIHNSRQFHNTSSSGAKQHGHPNSQNVKQQMKPPLYSLTFAHPAQESEFETHNNPLQGLTSKNMCHSIDQNAPANCVIADGQNVFEKKKMRFEKIQKLRGGQPPSAQSEKLAVASITGGKVVDYNLIIGGGISSSASESQVPGSQKRSLCEGSSSHMGGGTSSNISQKRSNNSYKKQKSKTQMQSQTSTVLGTSKNSRSRQRMQQIAMDGLAHPFTYTLTQSNTKHESSSAASHNSHKKPSHMQKQPDAQYPTASSVKKQPSSVSGNSLAATIQNSAAKKKSAIKSKNQLSLAATTVGGVSKYQMLKYTDQKLNIVTNQDPIQGKSQSQKKNKTPKYKPPKYDDLFNGKDLVTSPFNKKLTDFQPIAAFNLPYGKSAKNQTSSTIKMPLFQSTNLNSKREIANPTASVLVQIDHSNNLAPVVGIEQKVKSVSFHNNMSPNYENKIKRQIDIGGAPIEPQLLSKLLKNKQDTDNALEQFKRKLNASYSNNVFSAKIVQNYNQMGGSTNGFNNTMGSSSQQSLSNQLQEFEKKYKKLSNVINKILQ